jgi:biopolymer transport protein ExbD
MRFRCLPFSFGYITTLSLVFSTGCPLSRAQGPERASGNDAVAFRYLEDKAPLAFRDLAAYAALLKRARDAQPADLAANARRDIGFRELWEHPEDHRSALIEVRGFVRGISSSESKLVGSGKLYEVWITPPDRESELFACVVERLPDGFRVDASDGEPVVFYGFFLKVVAYEGRDCRRGAPLLIGRLERDAGENRADPLRAEERERLPKEAVTVINVPAADERVRFTVERDGSLTFENKAIALEDLALTVSRLAAQIRQSALASRTALDANHGLPTIIAIRALGETPCSTILQIFVEGGRNGFRRFALKSPATEAAAEGKGEAKTAPAARHNEKDPPAGPRTIPISIVAGDRGQIAIAQVGEVQHASSETLRAELTSMLRDRELPFDRVSLRVDERLMCSELKRTIDLVMSLNVTSIDLRAIEGDER